MWRLRPPETAKRQIKDWLKDARKLTSSERKKDRQGRVIDERIAASRREEKSGTTEFLIIRRDCLTCYFIRSVSLSVALQVEEMIESD